MGKPALFLAAAMLLLPIVRPAMAQEQKSPQGTTAAASTLAAEAPNHISGYTAWDDDFFYIAVQVNKPTISAKNNAPFSHPLEDDAVIVSLQTDDDHAATKRTAHTFTVAVSAANGFQLYSGAEAAPLFSSLSEFTDRLTDITQNVKDPVEQQKKRLDLLGRVIKVSVANKGAARAGGGNAPGYTAEIAIPWADLGGKPNAGAKMGFSLSAQSKAAGSPALQSLSPGVKGASDLENPSLWAEVTFSNSPAASTPAVLVSPRVFTQKPVIDGEVSNGEWNGLALFTFGENPGNVAGVVSLEKVRRARTRQELIARPPHPAVALPPASAQPLPVNPHQAQKMTPLVAARYEYWYQADTRKAAPALHVAHTDQSSALAHHPLDGTGPWFSYDHLDWQRKQLSDMRQAGVDVVLPVYRGAARNRQLYADKGLTVLASALQSLRQAGQDYPQVGLFLDTDDLIQIFGDRPDMRDPAPQAALYEIIHNFYRHIPEEFRCVIPLSAENGSHRAYPVFLSDARAFKEFDSTFVAAIRGRCLRDFGADLIVLGSGSFQPKATLDGYFTPTQDKNFQFNGSGWIKVASVSPGYDSALLEDLPQTPTLRSEDKFRAGWTAANEKHPDIVLLDTWNDFFKGSEIAPSLETGFSASDLNRVYTRSFAGASRFNVKYLWHNVPEQMVPGETYTVHLRAQNTGLMGWGSAPNLPVTFRAIWRRGGQVVAESPVVPLSEPILAGQNASITLPIKAAVAGGAALPEGVYSLEITAVEAGKKEPDAEIASHALTVSVHVRANGTYIPPFAASIVKSDLPLMMEAGSGYLVDAVLRNEGSQSWRKADGVRVSLRLYRTASAENAAGSSSRDTLVPAADASMPLTQDVLPGQEAKVHLLLPLVDTEGKPLPVWTQEQLWTYTARWEVAKDSPSGVRPVAAEAGNGAEGISFAPTPIVITDFDFGVRFVGDKTPSSLPADRKQPISLSLLNAGTQTWKRDQVRIGYHWYYMDGTELRWEDAQTPIPQDVPPGGRINDMLVDVTAPPTDGTYFLMWDVKFGDMWTSTSAATRPFDSPVHTVQVVGGRLVFTDLTKAYNLDGVSDSEHLAGNFDNLAHAFPAELMPPYTDASVTPSGMWLPSETSGPESPRRISFRWGPKEGKSYNFIACKGQRVELGKTSGQCRVLHIVAASTGKEIQTELKLIFQEPTSQSEDQYAFSVSRWDQPPTRGEEVALLARRHYEKDGLKPGAVALYHYEIKVREPRKLVAIILPNLPEIKIAAITLEK